MDKLNIAILGAGIFSKDTYLPLIKKNSVTLKAIWSRKKESVDSLMTSAQRDWKDVDGYSGDEGLDELLSNKEIEAVLVILPIQVMLQTVEKCLNAGKHVFQEKPIGQSVSQALESISKYRNNLNNVWHVGENFRFEITFLRAIELINKNEIGNLIKIDLNANLPMNTKNKYFGSQWRRDLKGCPGGFLLESAIHSIATLRMICEQTSAGPLKTVSAHILHVKKEELPPSDTLVSWLTTINNVITSYSITYAAIKLKFTLSIVGTEGTIEIDRLSTGGYDLLCYKDGSTEAEIKEKYKFEGMEQELKNFIDTCHEFKKEGKDVMKNRDSSVTAMPEEAAKDLAVIEALFESDRLNGKPVDIVYY